jgi:hypothetical protein
VAVALSAIALGASYLLLSVSPRQAALFLVGALAGIVLYHAAFGFTTAWRVFIADRRGEGIRAQMLLFAATAVVFLPAIGMGQLFGQPVRGSVAPLSLGVVIGAFIFGAGMQLARGLRVGHALHCGRRERADARDVGGLHRPIGSRRAHFPIL